MKIKRIQSNQSEKELIAAAWCCCCCFLVDCSGRDQDEQQAMSNSMNEMQIKSK